MNHDHTNGTILGALSAIGVGVAWLLAHLQAIDGLLQFCVLLVALVTGLVGLRKVMRK